jgi:hypothetical protein
MSDFQFSIFNFASPTPASATKNSIPHAELPSEKSRKDRKKLSLPSDVRDLTDRIASGF